MVCFQGGRRMKSLGRPQLPLYCFWNHGKLSRVNWQSLNPLGAYNPAYLHLNEFSLSKKYDMEILRTRISLRAKLFFVWRKQVFSRSLQLNDLEIRLSSVSLCRPVILCDSKCCFCKSCFASRCF